jgi:hypothetical protein
MAAHFQKHNPIAAQRYRHMMHHIELIILVSSRRSGKCCGKCGFKTCAEVTFPDLVNKTFVTGNYVPTLPGAFDYTACQLRRADETCGTKDCLNCASFLRDYARFQALCMPNQHPFSLEDIKSNLDATLTDINHNLKQMESYGIKFTTAIIDTIRTFYDTVFPTY